MLLLRIKKKKNSSLVCSFSNTMHNDGDLKNVLHVNDGFCLCLRALSTQHDTTK